jgi:peptidoglycan hydrolase CwlO-like protein
MSEEKIMEHFKECRPAIDNACATLSGAQSKLKRNVVLLRQVKSLNKQNLSLRKTVRDLRLQAKLEAEDKDELNPLTGVAEV